MAEQTDNTGTEQSKLDFSGVVKLCNGDFALVVPEEGTTGYFGYRIIGHRLLFDIAGNSIINPIEDIVQCLRERCDVPIEIPLQEQTHTYEPKPARYKPNG